MKYRTIGFLAVSFLVGSSRVHAQSDSDIAARRELLRAAEQADAANDHVRALDLATRASVISMTPSLRHFIADQQSALGRIAEALGSADACVREAQHDTSTPNRDAIISQCQQLSTQLQPRAGHVVVHAPSDAPSSLRIVVNGTPMNSVFVGLPYVVTPGAVTVDATADGYEPFHASVRVVASGTADVTLALVRATTVAATSPPHETSAGSVAPAASTPAQTPVAAPPPPPSESPSIVPAAALAGVGVVSLVVSGIFFALRGSAVNTLNGYCTAPDASGQRYCYNDPDAHAALNSANTDGIVSVAALAVGIAALAAGVGYFAVTHLGHHDTPPHAQLLIGPSPSGAWLGARWRF